ncbi:12569_t:CDS:2 [Funneliformis geosporum]|uniref:12569_t:CDS:1 n=1 Tax=Funneliformis geosporum TaxID=1117311 RepID=A0A9W4T2T2_9GLOM|nr:12569_t:CDS:2 [Funneliformis geosporum]
MAHSFLHSSNRSSNKKYKFYKFQYETSSNIKVFHGYLNPSWNYSIISLNRLSDHGLDISRIKLKPITSYTITRDNKLKNIVGICELSIIFENNGVRERNDGSIGGSTYSYNYEKVEKKIREVLVLKESNVEFRLGNDFINDYNIDIEPNIKGKFTHQLRFEDGVTVGLKVTETDVERDEEMSDEDYVNENNKSTDDKIKENSEHIFKNSLFKLISRIGLSNLFILFLISTILILYNFDTKSQSLVEELLIIPYKLPEPGIQNQLESYARKLKTTTSFFELYELNQHQIPSNETSKTQKEEEKRGQELYSHLVEFTTSVDNTSRMLLDMYYQESSYLWLFQQNIKRLLKYFPLKKGSSFLLIVLITGGSDYFPLTNNFDELIDDIDEVIINNIDSVMREVDKAQNYHDAIILQIEKMKIELEKFIIDSSKPFSSWLNALIRFAKIKGGKIDNLGEVDYDTALKVEKLLIALNIDLFEISTFFTFLKVYLDNHLNDLLLFSEHFRITKITKKITESEINVIQKHLDKLQNNHKAIFDTILATVDNDSDNESLVGCRIKKKINQSIFECSD